MMVGAALWGIEHGIEPPSPVPAPESARELLDPEIGPLPRSLFEAADRFGASKAAQALFGTEFVDHLSGFLRAEDAACRSFVSTQERARYLHHA
jgi:glutamine synthetase